MILPYNSSASLWFFAESIWELAPEVVEAAVAESTSAAVVESVASISNLALAVLAPLIEPPVKTEEESHSPAPQAEPEPSQHEPVAAVVVKAAAVKAAPSLIFKGIRWVPYLAWHLQENPGWQRVRDEQFDGESQHDEARASHEQATLRRRNPECRAEPLK